MNDKEMKNDNERSEWLEKPERIWENRLGKEERSSGDIEDRSSARLTRQVIPCSQVGVQYAISKCMCDRSVSVARAYS
jgi:hypothetical protein